MRRALVLVSILGGCAPEFAGVEQAVSGTAVVSLTWDDTFADQQVAVDQLDARGMRGTFYVNSARIGAAGYLSASQLLAWQQQGHEIAGHTSTHANLPALDPDEERQVCNDRVALLAGGFVVTSFAYPFGASDPLAEQIAAECGYNSARGVGGGANPIPPANLYDLRTPPSVKPETTLADLQGYVIAAEPTGGWVPLVFHHVCDGCSSIGVSPSTLAAFLDWLAARGSLVRTVDEVIGGDVRPGVAGPPATANRLVNPSLELDANADAVPDCWQRGGTGTNAATFTLTTSAFAGAVAQRMDVTSFTSGARRLVSKQDAGACAPAAVPGHVYRVSAHYHSTVPPRFTAYVRSTDGTWRYFAQSPLLPASPAYVPAVYTIPALPADATAISVGLSLYEVGSITMDAFELVDTNADTTPPAAAVSSPAPGAHVGGIAPIVAATSDDVGVVRVRFYLDGVQLGTRTVTPFKWNWNTATTTPGPHTVAVQAEDAAGNATRSPDVSIVVD